MTLEAHRDYTFSVRRLTQRLLIDFTQIAVNDPEREHPDFEQNATTIRDLARRLNVTIDTELSVDDVVSCEGLDLPDSVFEAAAGLLTIDSSPTKPSKDQTVVHTVQVKPEPAVSHFLYSLLISFYFTYLWTS